MRLKKIVILGHLIFLLSCGNSSVVKLDGKSKLGDEINVSKILIKNSTPLTTTNEITHNSEIYRNQIQDIFISEECIFKREKIQLPKIRGAIGDTIKIENTYNWISNLEITKNDIEIKKVIRRGSKFFQVNQTKDFVLVGFLEDEGEYIGIYIYSIDKSNCEVIGKELLAETTAWENGYKETVSIIEDDFTLIRDKMTGAKDWGDYTKWVRDTITTKITIDNNGKINLAKQ